MTEPTIGCICPTYKRPDMLRNLIACFEAQTYPHKRLVIIDDVPQHDTQGGHRWELFANRTRYPDLPKKFNDAARILAAGDDIDIICIMEDDDVYLPEHLGAIAAAWHGKGTLQFFAPDEVFSTYNQPPGGTQLEGAAGRFHASWAYTIELFTALRGYPDTPRLDYDQQMHRLAREAAGGTPTAYDVARPTYVYRWGNPTYHGSQSGEAGYQQLWEDLGKRAAPWVGATGPEFDEETRMIYESFGC